MTTIKDLAQEYVNLYCRDNPAYRPEELAEAHNDMVDNFKYDLREHKMPVTNMWQKLTEEQQAHLRSLFSAYAEND